MIGLMLLSLLASVTAPTPPAAYRCQEVARVVSGCPRYVLGLSRCEHAHRCMCETIFPE